MPKPNARRGRPANDDDGERKSRRIVFYVTPTEAEALFERAKLRGISVSDLCYRRVKPECTR